MLSKIPRGRFVTAEEIASLAAFCASSDCSFTTGAVFDISGGRDIERSNAAAPSATDRHRPDVRRRRIIRVPRHHSKIPQHPDGLAADRLGALHQRLRADADRVQPADPSRLAADAQPEAPDHAIVAAGRLDRAQFPGAALAAARRGVVDHFHVSVSCCDHLGSDPRRMVRLASVDGNRFWFRRCASDHASGAWRNAPRGLYHAWRDDLLQPLRCHHPYRVAGRFQSDITLLCEFHRGARDAAGHSVRLEFLRRIG